MNVFTSAYPGMSFQSIAWRFAIELVAFIGLISIVPITIITYAMQIGGIQ